MKKLQTLYRPVGKKELELIIGSGNSAYPPRLDWQPIFYPVLNYEYARQIAVKWNLDDPFSGYAGFVTQFDIPVDYLSKYEVQNVGGSLHNELWVPAEELAEFNKQIVGSIQISGRYYGEKYEGIIEASTLFKDLTAKEQWLIIKQKKDFSNLIKQESCAIQINWEYWKNHTNDPNILADLLKEWKIVFSDIELSI